MAEEGRNPMEVFLASTMDLVQLGSFLGQVNRKERAFELFEHYGVIPTRAAVFQCPTCGREVRTYTDNSRSRGWRFRCPQRHVTYEATYNTFLEQAMLNTSGPDIVVSLIQYWLLKVEVSTAASCTGVAKDTAVAWYGYCRDVAMKNALHTYEELGGPTDVVEVDETHLFKRKYHEGRETMYRHIWLFGGISRTTKKVFGLIVPDRTADTLLETMQTYIHPDTYICTDGYVSYNNVAQIFTDHGVVNHRNHFVNPPRENDPLWMPVGRFDDNCLDKQWTGDIPNGYSPFRIHTQNVERSWRTLKAILKTCNRPDLLNNYVGEWMYRRNILDRLPTIKEKFARFMGDIGNAYPGIGREKMHDILAECHCHVCEPR